jgi:hypothetical protein
MSQRGPSRSLSSLVGAKIRAHREERDWTQDRLGREVNTTGDFIGYLFHCLRTGARPGSVQAPGAVALTSAAHAGRVAHIWPARFRASPQGGERLKRGLLCSK